jgi:hypothetical protein
MAAELVELRELSGSTPGRSNKLFEEPARRRAFLGDALFDSAFANAGFHRAGGR